MDRWFTAYFRRDNSATGNTAVLLSEDGTYPARLAWEGGVYELDFAHDTAPEAHYEYIHDLPENSN
ncbi:hypothetical protein [Microbacterium sp. LWH13-1.2]|uniref:hypothetical protein n=1 Tax=Microbacterium sp. LWH13-1.2 TaxID=3135260 RepID=UPI003138B484